MIQFYKPNPKVTGCACSFWLNRDGTIMSSFIKQDSWNDAKKTGSFSKNKDNPKARVIVKLNRIEIAGIIDTIESNREFSVYHNSEKQTLQIRFCPYLDREDQVTEIGQFSGEVSVKNDKASLTGPAFGVITKKAKAQKGFSFSVNKQDKEDSTSKSSFLIGLTFPEARLLKNDLSVILNETFAWPKSREDAAPIDGTGFNPPANEAPSLPSQTPPKAEPARKDPAPVAQEEDLW